MKQGSANVTYVHQDHLLGQAWFQMIPVPW